MITISGVGMEDKFVLEVEPICDCGCEMEGGDGFEHVSDHCSYQGDSVCGECQCYSDAKGKNRFWGTNCQCEGNQTSSVNPESNCRFVTLKNSIICTHDFFRPPASGPSSPLCSGRGSCECGKCVCEKNESMNIYGQFCECDDKSCDRSLSGLVCGGHGRCDCGRCECDAGWTGPACDCLAEVTQCLSPDGGICSGHGDCVCGQCKRCDDGYSGQFCSECITCPDKFSFFCGIPL